jgi:hypothetical protein
MFWTMPCSTDSSPTLTSEAIATPLSTGCASSTVTLAWAVLAWLPPSESDRSTL